MSKTNSKNTLYSTVSNSIAKRALSKLEKGDSLRKIASVLGISNQTVWRIGDKHGVYSVRSPY